MQVIIVNWFVYLFLRNRRLFRTKLFFICDKSARVNQWLSIFISGIKINSWWVCICAIIYVNVDGDDTRLVATGHTKTISQQGGSMLPKYFFFVIMTTRTHMQNMREYINCARYLYVRRIFLSSLPHWNIVI